MQFDQLRRREFISLLGGGAAAWPLAARAQQPTMPVIGYLNGASAAQFTHLLAAFREGLSETGYAEGQNVAIEYRYADGQYDRLPALAADLAGQKVSVIVATAGTPTIRAAKAATATIPIVFVIGGDPVMFGLVASLNRPGGNITGITLVGAEIVAKRLGLLLELVPSAAVVGVLANPKNPIAMPQVTELQTASKSLGREIDVLNASSETEIERAFATLDQQHVQTLVVTADPFFDDRRDQIIALAAGTVGVIEVASFVSGFGSTAEFSTSKAGVFHSEDTSPTDVTGGAPSPASPVKSLFQIDAIGLKTTLWASWGLRAAGHAQWLQGATW
jgi:putative ABC transport system substrate-binding protein